MTASPASPVHRQAGGAVTGEELLAPTVRPDFGPRDREARLAALTAQIAAVQGRTADAVAGRSAHHDGTARDGIVRDRTARDGTVRDRTARDGTVRDRTARAGSISSHRPGPSSAEPAGDDSAAARDLGGDRDSGDQIATAKAICLRLLAVAPRPRAGLAQALRRKEIPDDIAESVLDRLAEVGLIDDVAYAQGFVRSKHRDRALGRSALRGELRKLGVDEEIMTAAVDTVDASAERVRAAELIAKRVDAAMAAGPIAARRRLLGLLSRRGYSPEIALPVVYQALGAYSDSARDWS